MNLKEHYKELLSEASANRLARVTRAGDKAERNLSPADQARLQHRRSIQAGRQGNLVQRVRSGVLGAVEKIRGALGGGPSAAVKRVEALRGAQAVARRAVRRGGTARNTTGARGADAARVADASAASAASAAPAEFKDVIGPITRGNLGKRISALGQAGGDKSLAGARGPTIRQAADVLGHIERIHAAGAAPTLDIDGRPRRGRGK